MKYKLLGVVLSIAFVVALAGTAMANHSWGGYHWARTSNPLSLKLGDNVSGVWDSSLATASYDWSLSSVLDTNIVGGQSSKNCRPTQGRIEVCNSKYGNNGWLGIAQIWASGSHITQAVVKLNDTYFNTAKYNTSAWRNLVLCQEVGHTFGLDHQDEIFDNVPLGTCMDYTSDPTPNQHPNLHDYEELETIYNHLDTTNTAFGSINSNKGKTESGEQDSVLNWGREVRKDARGNNSLYERDLGNGQKVITFVTWAE